MAVMASEAAVVDLKPTLPAKVPAPAEPHNEEDKGVNGHTSPSRNGIKSPDTLTKPKPEAAAEHSDAAEVELKTKNEGAFASNQAVSTSAPAALESAAVGAASEQDAPTTDLKAEAPSPPAKTEDAAEVLPTKEEAKDSEMTDAPVDVPASTTAPDVPKIPALAEKTADSADAAPSDAKPETVAAPNSPEPVGSTQDTVATGAGNESTTGSKPQPPSLSDLAIASQKSTEASDTSMTDAPPQSSKVARERDEDASDEPAAKRARKSPTEAELDAQSPSAGEPVPDKPDVALPNAQADKPKDAETASHDETGTETKVAVDPMDVDEGQPEGSDVVPPYPDAEPGNLMHPGADDEPIPESSVRSIKNVLSGVKKTKAGGNFKDSVVNLWPALAESYSAKVTTPMDISLMERKLRGSQYATLGDFKKDVKLLVTNSVAFNGPDHDVTLSAVSVVENIWDRMHKVKAEEPVKAAKKEKPAGTRHTERVAALPRPKPVPTPTLVPPAVSAPPPAPATAAPPPPTAAAAKPATEKAAPAKVVETPIHAAPPARRDSTKDDDRPKRPINPPKKDLGYEPKGSKKKKLSPELRFCDNLVKDILKPKNQVIHWPFLRPVDEINDGAPGYYTVIKKPMDLGTIGSKLQDGLYGSADDFKQDFELMLNNCFTFNPPTTEVHHVGKKLESWFKEKWPNLGPFVAKHSSKTPRRASASSPSAGAKDDSDDEAPASEPEPEPDAADNLEEIEELRRAVEALQNKIKDARKEQVDLLNQDSPDIAQMDIQHSIIMMLTNGLADKKKKLDDLLAARPAPKPKPAAKPKKAASSAANAAPPSKKAPGGASKKSGSGSSKKAGAKRLMTTIEKEAIANGINDLDGTYITQAIDIIKKDTHQQENGEGELELEIEQLSLDALHKLYDVMCKGIKGFRSKVEAQVKEAQAAAAQAAPNPVASAMSRTQKPKKNKPMGKGEQERKLEQLAKLKTQYQQKGRQSSGSQEPPPSHEAAGAAAEPAQTGDDSDVSSEED